MNKEEVRAKEFLSCLGNGKDIYQCESENEMIDERLKEYIAKTAKEFEDKVKNKENVMIMCKGKSKIGMSTMAFKIGKYANQVFNEDLNNSVDKNITMICKHGKK